MKKNMRGQLAQLSVSWASSLLRARGYTLVSFSKAFNPLRLLSPTPHRGTQTPELLEKIRVCLCLNITKLSNISMLALLVLRGKDTFYF